MSEEHQVYAAALAAPRFAAVDLNQPGSYVHWSIFDVSVANLVLIAVMVVIFGAALVLPFPGRHRTGPAEAATGPTPEEAAAPYLGDPADARMWTSRVRRWGMRVLPPGKVLPDRQPAYVASWIYVFGVWSVELFMAFLVIHLWGKFWMAAWRGRRALTWITGVAAFVAAVLECFTGYLSQQNFDSQWIATNGKDAFNAAGVGAFFNVMNFGQMLLWHVVLIPVILVALAGGHVLLVRVRGVAHPLPPARISWRDRAAAAAARAADAGPWRGRTRRYDILKEATIAAAVATGLVLVLAGVLSSPDVPPVSVRSSAKIAPADFLATAAAELNGTALAASYGPPYNHGTAAVQQVGPVNWQTLAGVTQPIDAARVFVLSPLTTLAAT